MTIYSSALEKLRKDGFWSVCFPCIGIPTKDYEKTKDEIVASIPFPVTTKWSETHRGVLVIEKAERSQRQIVVGSRGTYLNRWLVDKGTKDFINVHSFESSCGYRYQEGGSIQPEFVTLFDADSEAVENLIAHGFTKRQPK